MQANSENTDRGCCTVEKEIMFHSFSLITGNWYDRIQLTSIVAFKDKKNYDKNDETQRMCHIIPRLNTPLFFFSFFFFLS